MEGGVKQKNQDGGAPQPHPSCKPAGGRGEVEKPDRRSQGGDGGEMGRAGIFGAGKGNGSNSINSKIVI